MIDTQTIFTVITLLGELTAALLALMVAARPIIGILRRIALLTSWRGDDAVVNLLDRIIRFVESVLRGVSGVSK